MKQIVLVLLVSLCVYNFGFAGEWESTEVCVVKQGYGENEIAYSPGGPVGGPGSDTFEEPAESPHMAIVDNAENVLIISNQTYQFKGFSNTGEQIFDYTYETADYKRDMYKEFVEKIYVDSLFHIYVLSDTAIRHIPVLDYNGQVIEKIKPFGQDSRSFIDHFNRSPSGILLVFNWNYGWVRYLNGVSIPGGHSGFMANDGKYYTAYKKSSSNIEFTRYSNPDRKGKTESEESVEIPLDQIGINDVDLLDGGNGYYLYVYLSIGEDNTKEILEINLDFDVIDRLALTNEEQYGDFEMPPFVRFDGNIYEFLFREEGLHVVRWSKE